MTLGFTVQYPYTITEWLNSGALTKTGAGSPTNSITAAFDTTAPVCAIGDYIAAGDNTGGNCYKAGIDVTFNKGSATDCSFDGQVYTANFNVRCASGIPDADCPLQATDTGSAEFTITSDNWYGFSLARYCYCYCFADAMRIGALLTLLRCCVMKRTDEEVPISTS
jgi:hypothetical protein